MRGGVKNVTKMRENWHAIKLLKMSQIFPLYAKCPKKRDQNWQKSVDIFPLYASRVKKRDQNWHKIMTTLFLILTHIFPLICDLGQKT